MRRILLAISLLALASCGFHLRGTGQSTIEVAEIYIVASDLYGELQREVESAFILAGASLVEKDVAPYTLNLVSERSSRRPVSSGGVSDVSDYELRFEVTFELSSSAGATLLPETRVFSERIYAFDSGSLVSSSEEEDVLIDELRRDVAAQVIRRVDAAVRQAVSEDAP